MHDRCGLKTKDISREKKKCNVLAATGMNNLTRFSISPIFPRIPSGVSAHVPPLVIQTEASFPLSLG